ncbi:hypothetical protein [Stenoxybacter acetivorans]|uniref:hypothetical protein n=1 Tax=Stenoxybacter acetivorans TaxID=422441 RepID=UPI00056D960C|nr:hypothetical protein [Stenoxybacter acetivorans]
MGIYRCTSCGLIAEQTANSAGICEQCRQLVKVYDTVFFVKQVLSRYTAAMRELRSLKEELAQEENTVNDNSNNTEQSFLSNSDWQNTDVLATTQQHAPLQQWFAAKGIKATFDYQAVNTTGFFDEAASALGKDYAQTKDLLGKINWHYRKNIYSLSMDLSKSAQKDITYLTNLCRTFYSQTLFSKYFYEKNNKIIRLNLQSANNIRRFFEGSWLEWYALVQIIQAAQAKGEGYRFSCTRNTVIQFANEDKFELDALVMPIGGEPIIIECKSGEFRSEIEKYVRLKKRMGLNTKQFVIFSPELDDAQAASLSSMYELTFLPLNRLENYLLSVI